MTSLLFHKKTSSAVDNFINKPSHALIITGQKGVGKKSLAEFITGRLLNLSESKLNSSGKIKFISSQDSTITIEQIREAQSFTKLKTIGGTKLNRAIIIIDAENMGREAQNALLKLLEEPPSDTIIVLTSSNISGLLPTITSRAQTLLVQSPTQEQTINYFAVLGHDQAEVQKAYYIGEGRIGLIHAILVGESTSLTEQIEQAKNLLELKQFDRLKLVDSLSKNKATLTIFLQALEIVCSAGLKNATQKNAAAQIRRWHSCLKQLVDSQNKLTQQANTKLLLTDLMLSL